jgi:ribosomal protein L11 methyltransferase
VASPDQVELLEALAGELGALSVSIEDAAQEAARNAWLETTPGAPPPWTQLRVHALFAADVDPADLERTIARFLGPSVSCTGSVDHIRDRDWVREWMRQARPLRFGKRLWVCPTSAPLPAGSENGVLLRLDPGLGFGTGTHESTALCLEWLESQRLAGTNAIDYGCGSGILGIAALLLGAERVRACDVDLRALDATRENAQRNHVTSRLWVGPPDQMSGDPAHVIVANILSSTLCELAAKFERHQRPHGDLVLSGILSHQAAAVEEAFSLWYSTAIWKRRGDWVLLHGRHRG